MGFLLLQYQNGVKNDVERNVSMKIMSVDFGDSRTGIAVCDKSEFLASPLTVIFEKNFDRCLEKTADLAKQEQAELIVVGFPKNMNNTDRKSVV